jgi:hypothetical protein
MQVHDALVLAASPLRREKRSGDVDVKKYLTESTK